MLQYLIPGFIIFTQSLIAGANISIDNSNKIDQSNMDVSFDVHNIISIESILVTDDLSNFMYKKCNKHRILGWHAYHLLQEFILKKLHSIHSNLDFDPAEIDKKIKELVKEQKLLNVDEFIENFFGVSFENRSL